MTMPGPAASAQDPQPIEPTDSDPVSTDQPVLRPVPEGAGRQLPTVWEQMGGLAGMLDSGLPIVVFVIVNSTAGLTGGIIAALAAGLLIFAFRLIRRRPVTQAIGGLLGVGVAAYIAHRSGSAGGYFLLGIYSYLVYGGLLLLSMILRLPAVGLIWEGINGRGLAWRKDRAQVRRYDYATVVWVVIFAARFLVQNALLGHQEIGWLAFARIVMGYPLYLIGIGLSVWIVMRDTGWQRPPLRTILAGFRGDSSR